MTSSLTQQLYDLANKLRIHSIEMTEASKSGHPTSCCSMAELMSVLFFHAMKYDPKFPKNPNSDRFVLSKGHAAPILYAAWAEVGLFPVSELLNLRKVDSDLEGHPTPRLSFVDVATGSLGQGLGVAAGMAYMGKYVEKCPYKVYCLMGDGESMEGSVWEAAAFSSQYSLDNLVAIIDINRLAQSDAAPLGHDLDTYEKRWSAFGFNTYPVDGHSVESILGTLDKINSSSGKPSIILAKTFKGFGITGVSDMMGWHGKALGKMAPAAIEEISNRIVNKSITGLDVFNAESQRPPSILTPNNLTNQTFKLSSPPNYQLGQSVATRMAYGLALAKLGEANPLVIALDADVKNSTFSDKFKAKFPNRFVDCFIAEQNMVSVAVGAGTRDRAIPFVSTFGAFFARAFDQVRMAAISFSKIKLCGSHVGVSIGEDGGSQMALEDIATFRAIPGSVVFYPSDAVAMERAVELAAGTNGIAYIRSSRPETPVIYGCDEEFAVGKAKVVRITDQDNICMVGAGVTLFEILKAATILQQHGFSPRVIDLFTVKPIDLNTVLEAARACGGKVVTVEDHYIEGGIFEAVSSALAPYTDVSVRGIAVREVPHSGKPNELLDKYGISAEKIAETIKTYKF